jgi:hypothetical protein
MDMEENMDNLICECGNTLSLKKDTYIKNFKGNEFKFDNCFFFDCDKCNKIYLPDIIENICDNIIDCVLEKNSPLEVDFYNVAFHLWNKEFGIINELPYKICKEDYYCFPGLYRKFNVGFLTPMYFNIEVLLKYIYNPKYQLRLNANTYGSISTDEFNIQFGINENNKVLMWYGDVCELPINEQYYLLSENIESDHCILSEFYMAQINSKWAHPSEINKLIKNRSILNAELKNTFKINFYQLELETLKKIKDIKPLIFTTEENFSIVINPLNMILVESINNKDLKKILKTSMNDELLQNRKGLKLFELFIDNVLHVNKAASEISPLYVLYDLRIYCSHLRSDEDRVQLLKICNQRLDLDENTTNFKLIYDTLINKLNAMYDIIINAIKK